MKQPIPISKCKHSFSVLPDHTGRLEERRVSHSKFAVAGIMAVNSTKLTANLLKFFPTEKCERSEREGLLVVDCVWGLTRASAS